ncbi:MAG TPA: alpha/beta fold hydrolase [Elusimicrobiota bacterium]|nr:alpha/beta fold hydrolase [Elusimicrobiota bacterium]
MNELWRSEYPFVGRHLDLGGHRMHYLDEGQGETVLMVHGNPSWSFYFRELVKTLRTTRRCVVPDHIGMGLSDRPSEDSYRYTLRSRIDDLDALMARVAPSGPVTLVLHDWGGMIGMGWAVRHPERVKAIVAFNTACFRLPPEKNFPGLLRIMRGSLSGVPIRATRLARRFVLSTCTNKRKLSPAAQDAYLSVCDGWKESLAVHRFVQDIPLAPGDPAWDVVVDIESKLGAFKDTPMLLPWGLKDWVFDESFLNGWRARFPKAAVRPFPDCGHFLLEDAPEELVPLIREFAAPAVSA